MEAQGYGIDKNILYQDNMSEILLEKNVNNSRRNNTKHINVRYYFINYRVESGEVVTKHCPTTEMLGYIFTKPLQGALFRKFRAEIMNIPDNINTEDMGIGGKGIKNGVMWKLHNETKPECPQECVGNCDNVSGRNGDENVFFGTVSRICTNTSKGVFFCEK